MTDLKIAIKMLNSYKNLIMNFDKNIKKWKKYGDHDKCLFCRKYYKQSNYIFFDKACYHCPLAAINDSLVDDVYGCSDKSLDKLSDLLDIYFERYHTDYNDKYNIIDAAMERYTILEMALIDKQVIDVNWE